VFLGLAFNWGALLAWTAHTGSLGWPAVVLYTTGIAWTLFYDTIYAHQDVEDDALIGVKSTARLFGAKSKQWLSGFAALTIVLFASAILWAVPLQNHASLIVALLGVCAMGAHLVWQLRAVNTDDPENCLKIFRSNRDAGLISALFLAIALML
jgi:4-hydroxybenzoate polyprenyltransferase